MKFNEITLGELTESTRPICYGVLKPGEFINEGVPLIRVTDISKNYLDASNLHRISSTLDNEFSRSRLEGGEILLSIQGTVGRVAITPPDLKGANISRTIAVIDPDDRIHKPYLYHYLRRLGDTSGFYISGSTRASLNISELRNLKIPLPPLEEQRRIAAILDKAEYLKANTAKRSSILEALSRSMFINSFGLPSKNENQFPIRKLVDICNPKQWPTISSKDLKKEGYPVFGANGLIGYYEKFNHPDPTVLVTCRGATCGTVNISPPKCYVTGNSMAMDSPDPALITIEYLAWVLRVRGMHDVISGSAQPQITRQGLEAITIPIPSIQEQKSFANKLKAVTRLGERSCASEASVLETSKSLLEQLIYG